MQKTSTTILLLLGIIIIANVLARQIPLRLDLTQGGQYTLSKATKDIIRTLPEPVTITAYFSNDLPTPLEKEKNDFRDLLIEYNSISADVAYKIVTPNTPEEEQKAQESGILPRPVQVRQNNELKVQNIYAGAIIEMGQQKDIIPFLQPGSPQEYLLSTGIKKISVTDKPSVGFIQGHGEPPLENLQGPAAMLSILYNVEPLNLSAEPTVPARFKTIILLSPRDSLPVSHLSALDEYVGRGGNLLVGIDAVNGDLQQNAGLPLTTGLEGWLREKGFNITAAFVTDANCGSVTVQQQQGPFRFNSQIQFPYFPLVNSFADHPSTKGLESVMLPFASPVKFSGDSSIRFTPLLFSSENSGLQNPPFQFDIQKQWTANDFPMGPQALGGVAEGPFIEGVVSRILVIGDGEFATTPTGDNTNLLVNGIDWLSDDTGLIELRTKGATSRPIKQLEASAVNTYKYINFLLPLLLVILYGFFRASRRRAIRNQRLQENYG